MFEVNIDCALQVSVRRRGLELGALNRGGDVPARIYDSGDMTGDDPFPGTHFESSQQIRMWIRRRSFQKGKASVAKRRTIVQTPAVRHAPPRDRAGVLAIYGRVELYAPL